MKDSYLPDDKDVRDFAGNSNPLLQTKAFAGAAMPLQNDAMPLQADINRPSVPSNTPIVNPLLQRIASTPETPVVPVQDKLPELPMMPSPEAAVSPEALGQVSDNPLLAVLNDPDTDEDSMIADLGNQFVTSLNRNLASGVSRGARFVAEAFDKEEGVFLLGEQGEVVDARSLPAGADARIAYKKQLQEQFPGRIEYTSSGRARLAQQALQLGSASLTEFTARHKVAGFFANKLENGLIPWPAKKIYEGLNDLTDGAIVDRALEVQGDAESLARIIGEDSARISEGKEGFEMYADAASGSIGATVPAMVAGLMGRAAATQEAAKIAALGTMSLFAGALREQEMVERGESIFTADLMGSIKSVTEPATEALPIASLFKQGPFVAKVADFMLKEVPTELLETTLDDLAMWVVLEPEMPAGEALSRWGSNLVDTAIVTMIAGPAQVGAIGAIDKSAQLVERAAPRLIKIGGDLIPEAPSTAKANEARDAATLMAEAEKVKQAMKAAMEAKSTELEEFDFDGELADALGPVETMLNESDPELRELHMEDAPSEQVQGRQMRMQEVRREVEVTRADGSRGTLDSLNVQPGEVVIAGRTEAEAEVESLTVAIEAKEQSNEFFADSVTEQEIQELAILKEQRAAAEVRIPEERKQINLVRDQLQQLAETFLPGKEVILNFEGITGANKQYNAGEVNGRYVGTVQDASVEGIPETVIISLNPSLLTSGGVKEVMEVTAHELGHGLVADAFQGMFRRYPNLVKTIQKAYVEQIGKAVRRTSIGEANADLFSVTRGEDMLRNFPPSKPVGETYNGILNAPYVFGIEEFAAEHMVRSALGQGKNSLGKDVDKAFKDAGSELKNLFDVLQSDGYVPNESFEDFVEASMNFAAMKKAEAEKTFRLNQMIAAVEEAKTLTNKWTGGIKIDKLITDLVDIGGPAAAEALLGPVIPSEGKGGDGGGKRTITMKEFESKLTQDMTKFTYMTEWFAGVYQMAKMNNHLASVQAYIRANLNFRVTESLWTSDATKLMLDWRKHTGSTWLNSDHSNRFDAALVEIDIASDDLGRRLRNSEIQEIIKKHNLVQEDVQLMNRIWAFYGSALTEVENSLVERVIRAHDNAAVPDTFARDKEVASIRNDFQKMRDRNYMPHTRFGKYTVTVKAAESVTHDGVKYSKGSTVLYTSFDTQAERLQGLKELRKVFASDAFNTDTSTVVSDTVMSFQGLQPEMALRIANTLNLKDEQVKQLQELVVKSAPGQSIRKHMLNRKGVAGYSEDMQRVTADYFARFAKHAARVKHEHELEEALEMGERERQQILGDSDAAVAKRTKRQRLLDALSAQKDYLLNPGEEYASVRAAGFFWYLGFSVKSAVVNMTQVPFVTYPYLAERFGDVATATEMARSMAVLGKHVALKGADKMAPGKFKSAMRPDELEMIEELIRRQVIDEGMVTMLAGLANDRSLSNLKVKGAMAQSIRVGQQAGAYLFQTAEKVNRYYSAMAAYNLALKAGKSSAQAVEIAQETVMTTQLEYARFNRPRLMRGKQSVAFLFYQYLTQMMYFVGTDPSAWRYVMTMLVAGGYTAMPGMENFLDVLDWTLTKTKKQLGMANPKTQTRVIIAQWINELADEVDTGSEMIDAFLEQNLSRLVEDGALSKVGPGGYNLQGSISLGRVAFFDTSIISSESDDKLSRLIGSAAGAPAEAALSIVYGTSSEEPWTYRRVEKMMPVFAKNAMKGYRRYKAQAEFDNAGNKVVEFDPSDPYTATHAIMEGIGFPRYDITQKKEGEYWAKDAVRYYENQARFIKDEYYSLTQREDTGMPPSEKDWENFEKKRERYNNSVRKLDYRMTIGERALIDSTKARRDRAIRKDTYGNANKKYGDLSQDIIDARR